MRTTPVLLYFLRSTSMNITLGSAIIKYLLIILGFPFNKTKIDEWNISDQTSDIQRLQPVLQARGLSGQTATLLSTSVMSPGKKMLINFIKKANGFFRYLEKISYFRFGLNVSNYFFSYLPFINLYTIKYIRKK